MIALCVILIIELILLYFLSSHLTSIIYTLLLKLFHSRRLALALLTILYLPGTIVHELSHLLIAEILRVPTGDISFVPEVEKINRASQEVKMGSLKLGHTDPLRKFLIGIAPFICGIAVLVGILYLWQIFWLQMSTLLQKAGLITLTGCLVFSISNNMFSSRTDMEGAWMFYILAAIIFCIIYFLGVKIEFSPQTTNFLQNLLALLSRSLGLVIGTNLVILLVNSLFLHGIRKLSG